MNGSLRQIHQVLSSRHPGPSGRACAVLAILLSDPAVQHDKAAQTRRQRRAQPQSEAQPQRRPKSLTQAHVTRRSRQRARPEMLTVAIRGPLAAKMRDLSETTGMSLAKLLQDALLVYGGQVATGYEPGTSLADWTAQQRD